MLRSLIAVLLLLWSNASLLAQVVKTEYFFDKDPGFGNGTALAISSGNNVSDSFTLPLTNVSVGFHTLYVRSQDAQGRWSQTASHTFHLFSGKAGSIAAFEYFIDADPGHGMATPITGMPGADNTLRFAVPLINVGKGFHTLFVRTRDDAGRWSLSQQHVFFNNDGGDTVKIAALEYYFTGNGQTSPTFVYNDFTPAPLVDLEFAADLSGLQSNAEYDMHMWAIASNGTKSQVLTKKVKVCDEQPAIAAFDFIPLGTQVSFIDSSAGSTKYQWDFGDGTIDSVSNPVHNYAVGGNYNVKLIVSNFCNSDTVSKQVNALSLQNSFPLQGGNSGTITLSIKGGGFTKATKISLVNGRQIEGYTYTVEENGRLIKAVFDITNEELGYWDIVAKNNTNTDVLQQSFSIDIHKELGITANVVGRTVFRAGRAEKFIISYHNLNNNDVYMVPLSLILPKDVKIDLLSKVAKLSGYSGLPSFDEDNISTTLDINGKTILPLIIHHIPANGTGKVEVALTAPNLPELPLTVIVNRPLVNSVKLPGQSDKESDAISGKCLTLHIGVALTAFGLVGPEFACAGSASLGVMEFSNSVASLFLMNPGKETVGDVLINTGSFVQSLTALGAAVLICFGVEITRPVTAGIAGVGIFLTTASVASDIIFNDGECFKQLGSYLYNLSSLTSFDPNEKIGNRGLDNYNYNKGASYWDYKIYFENADTAMLPAQEVIITDTLDKSKFDLSTFKLQSFGFGDSTTITVPSGLQFYATDTIIRRPGKIDLLVRMDGKLDTTTGIIKWRFLSLNPKTRELIDDPLDGFLPPNKTPREGEGFVSYSIMPKPDLPHGTEIRNKAAIYFDNNAPIITNEFLNTIDKVAPVSKVASLPAETYDTTFTVRWGGTDDGAGIRSYDVYYAVNNDSLRLWQYDVAATEATFTGQKDSTYSFYSIAKDYAGNIEEVKTVAEAFTVIKDTTTLISSDGKFECYPNPTDGGTWVEFTLATDQKVSIVANDMIGRKIAVIADRLFEQGTHKLFYDSSKLPTGVYIISLRSDQNNSSIKFLKKINP